MTLFVYLDYSSFSELFAPSYSNHVVYVNATLNRSVTRFSNSASVKSIKVCFPSLSLRFISLSLTYNGSLAADSWAHEGRMQGGVGVTWASRWFGRARFRDSPRSLSTWLQCVKLETCTNSCERMNHLWELSLSSLGEWDAACTQEPMVNSILLCNLKCLGLHQIKPHEFIVVVLEPKSL